MFYARINGDVAVEYPLTEKQLRKMCPASLPLTITNEMLEPLGFALVKEGSVAGFPQATKDMKVVIDTVTKVNGEWVRTYKLEAIAEPERGIRLANKWAEVRNKRDLMMLDGDWRLTRNAREVALGLPTTDNLTALHQYMQDLADIPTNFDDPYLVEFPTLD